MTNGETTAAGTRIDLPQISFARYLDLLKRRRWQVVPISLLGLVVGAMVAFFIPRYYVAETTIAFHGPVLEIDPRVEDPMRPIVDSAAVTIPATVPRALEELGWPEALSEDEERRNAFIDAVRGRLSVTDLGPHERGRRRAHVLITYADTDGQRAADFANKLVEVWVRTQKESLIEKADLELQDVSARMRVATETLQNAEQELASFEEIYKINPNDFAGKREGPVSEDTAALRELERTITQLKGRIVAVESRLRANSTLLASTPRRVPAPVTPGANDPLREAIEAAKVKLLVATTALGNIKPEHPQYAAWQLRQKQAMEELQALQAAGGGRAAETIENPDWVALRKQIDADQATLAGLRSELGTYEAEAERLRKRIESLPAIAATHRDLAAKRDRARETLTKLEEERRQKEVRKRMLAYQAPFEVLERAYVPQRPTEPNITLVALAGSAVGLAFAIGLILLLDVLQSTYKTVDDVERGLALPVLGGMNHMMTEEQRRRTQARRTRTSLVAVAFLTLVIGLVTFYYVAPTRLPTPVRDFLDVLLGTAK